MKFQPRITFSESKAESKEQSLVIQKEYFCARSIMEANTLLAKGTNFAVQIKRSRAKLFPSANWIVSIITSAPKVLSDGTLWNGKETVGHFRDAQSAKEAAFDIVQERF